MSPISHKNYKPQSQKCHGTVTDQPLLVNLSPEVVDLLLIFLMSDQTFCHKGQLWQISVYPIFVRWTIIWVDPSFPVWSERFELPGFDFESSSRTRNRITRWAIVETLWSSWENWNRLLKIITPIRVTIVMIFITMSYKLLNGSRDAGYVIHAIIMVIFIMMSFKLLMLRDGVYMIHVLIIRLQF